MSSVRWGLAALLVAAGPGAAGLGAQSAVDRSSNMEGVWAAADASGAAVVVEMDNRLRYLPDTVRVRVGETVRWRNTSDVLHTVTADGDRAVRATSVVLPGGASPFDSGDLAPGEEYSHTFTVAGEYRYFCIPHELAGMVGTVIVEGGG